MTDFVSVISQTLCVSMETQRALAKPLKFESQMPINIFALVLVV